jgi:hypothetical protein
LHWGDWDSRRHVIEDEKAFFAVK